MKIVHVEDLYFPMGADGRVTSYYGWHFTHGGGTGMISPGKRSGSGDTLGYSYGYTFNDCSGGSDPFSTYGDGEPPISCFSFIGSP